MDTMSLDHPEYLDRKGKCPLLLSSMSWTLLLHFVLFRGVFHLCFSHFDGYYVNCVFRSIHMGGEGYLVPFMALQDLGISHRPALVVLVDKRRSIRADCA